MNDGPAFIKMDKTVAGQDLGRVGDTRSSVGTTLEEPARELSGDTLKTGGYSRMEFRGVVQAGD